MIKRIIGALYGIFLEGPLDRLHNWQKRFEKEYLNYCRTGCKIVTSGMVIAGARQAERHIRNSAGSITI